MSCDTRFLCPDARHRRPLHVDHCANRRVVARVEVGLLVTGRIVAARRRRDAVGGSDLAGPGDLDFNDEILDEGV